MKFMPPEQLDLQEQELFCLFSSCDAEIHKTPKLTFKRFVLAVENKQVRKLFLFPFLASQ